MNIVKRLLIRGCWHKCIGRINQTFARRGRLVPLLEEALGAPDGKWPPALSSGRGVNCPWRRFCPPLVLGPAADFSRATACAIISDDGSESVILSSSAAWERTWLRRWRTRDFDDPALGTDGWICSPMKSLVTPASSYCWPFIDEAVCQDISSEV